MMVALHVAGLHDVDGVFLLGRSLRKTDGIAFCSLLSRLLHLALCMEASVSRMGARMNISLDKEEYDDENAGRSKVDFYFLLEQQRCDEKVVDDKSNKVDSIDLPQVKHGLPVEFHDSTCFRLDIHADDGSHDQNGPHHGIDG